MKILINIILIIEVGFSIVEIINGILKEND
jgi:hypothetical protein